MKVRGQRECTQCGTRWSYYETGSVACPECGSLHSVGLDDRTEHTAAPVEFDLTPVRAAIDEKPLEELAKQAVDYAGEYVRKAGFIDAGELRPLDEVFVAAMEVKFVGRDIARRMRVDDEAELYFVSLLRDADEGDRPNPTEVPEALAPARGLAVAAVLESYHRDVSRVRGDLDQIPRRLLGQLRDHRKRIQALDGDVPPREAERFLDAMRDLSRYLVTGDEDALATAQARLDEVQ